MRAAGATAAALHRRVPTMAAVLPGGVPGQANDNASAAVRLFTAGLPFSEAPKWYYQDLQGELQVGVAFPLVVLAWPGAGGPK